MGQTVNESDSEWVRYWMGKTVYGSKWVWVRQCIGRKVNGPNSEWDKHWMVQTVNGLDTEWVRLWMGPDCVTLWFRVDGQRTKCHLVIWRDVWGATPSCRALYHIYRDCQHCFGYPSLRVSVTLNVVIPYQHCILLVIVKQVVASHQMMGW